ncbi:phage terminase small subunit [Sphingomonas sp.]|jgi:hypothetical protein|uniref:phage terminase small subunit n=1 Tax=Sphingomonas sp. TaxID=28214 RepID=UPI002E14A239|nr:phage terminase small subunit [Sphingomonas sp.]HEV7287741.1 phage terminase small subunit [Sphingomonas sp.]
MSPARHHRERHAATATSADPKRVASTSEGGHAAIAPPAKPFTMTPARAAQDRNLAIAAAAVVAEQPSAASDSGTPQERATAQVNLRLQHDLRRLRDIASIEKKIEAKREMLPHYAAWVQGLVDAGVGLEEDVLPTVMIWRIDTGDFDGALVLIEHVLDHNLPLPARYERSAPALIVEEIATAASKIQQAGEAFPFEILGRIDMLTEKADMHDQIRAKLKKAIGIEQMRSALNDAGDAITNQPLAKLALETLGRARNLDQRVGVTDRIKKLTKLITALEPPAQTG